MRILKQVIRRQVAGGMFFASVNFTPKFLSTVASKKVSNITLISLNRPNKTNAFDLNTLRALKESIQQFESDDESAFAVLYGQGGNFSSGFDLHELSEMGPTVMCEEFNEFLKRPAKKPIIAAVSGYAVGQGFDLALWCDLRFVEEDVVMGFYNRRFAIPIPDITIKRLAKMIGTSRSMNVILHCRHLTGQEALDWGISNKTVSSGTAIGAAVNKAIQISRHGQESLLVDRTTLLLESECNSLGDEWIEEQSRNREKSLEKSKLLIEQFVKKEYGQHGSFKDHKNRDSMDFLQNVG